MCGYFCTGFIDFMLKSKNLLEYADLFSPNEYKNDKIILKYFQLLKRWKNYILLFAVGIENLKKPKIYYLLEKTLVLSITCSKCKNENEKLIKEESIVILKILSLIENMKLL